MENIYYGGLFKEIGIIQKIKYAKKDAVYFDYDIGKSSIRNLFIFTSQFEFNKLILNVSSNLSKIDIIDLSVEFSKLGSNVNNLIITSNNDLITMVMRKYIVKRNKDIKYAFNVIDNLDNDSYLICESIKPFKASNQKRIILDDRKYGNEGILYNRFNIVNEDVSIIKKNSFIKTKSL